MSHRRAVALVILCTLMWSMGGVVSRYFQTREGFEVTFWRSLFAALTVLAWFAWRGFGPSVRGLAQAGRMLWVSGLMWAAMFTCFMLSLSMTTVANVLITQSLAPVFTALLAGMLLRRPVGGRTWAAIAVATLGICLMYVFDVSALEGRHALGVAIALGVPAAAALNWVLVQRYGSSLDLTGAVLVGSVLSMAITLPLAWPMGVSGHDLLLLAMLGVFQLGIPCILVVQAARHLAAAKVSLLVLLEVVFGILLTWLFGSETPGWATLAGGTAVLAALVYNELTRSESGVAAARA